MFKLLYTLAALICSVTAQQTPPGYGAAGSTLSSASASALASASASPRSSSGSATNSASYPTRTLFLPLSNLGNIAASIVTAAPDSTVYGLACLHVTPSICPYNASVLITEGPSTLIYTETFDSSGAASPTRGPILINCTMSGNPSVTQAVCAGATSLTGLGSVQSTSTLSGAQLTYGTITITAGAEKLSNVATQTASSNRASSTSSGGAAPMATMAGWLAGGAVGAVALAVL
ncbi:hypothetical protein BAUCODRAFT_159884 [Baudoinia panamericana UAMH 10762]|uniref:GPI anchored protein n=1 Tax=Baudoinia panamericana (strain UAMH 10762) TaxID=717646 RepID=M2N0I5_BAUPA|nr:uncharacterized protein BAUCODRAFT_159884 [Baudoinia panamericana UAMH 10762]EMC92125.1 hypothetical protein BAUCODRAFT_159884 [Baudoinia panamericana UAMH 10762]